MFRHLLTGLVLTTAIASTAVAQDIDFIESFALAEDRAEALQELVPGTEPFYYFHCLHYQNTEQFEKVAEMLKVWDTRLGRSSRMVEIEHRQALLTYGTTPSRTLDYLTDKLDLRFNHQRRRPSAEPGLPTELDQEVISFERLNRRALARNNTNRFEDIALARAAGQELNKNQLRHLLQRLTHPKIVDLPQLIVRDLENRDAAAFGSYTIHQNLLLEQLDELMRLRPALRNETGFVNIYLARLAPGNDVNWRFDSEEHVAWLDRLWAFVSELNPSHNSLKACVLYRRLELDRTLGMYDRERFLTYLKLPRNVSYINPRLIEDMRSRRNLVDLNADFRQSIRLAPVRTDEPLVRDYLHHLLVDAADFNEFLPWVRDTYLRERFAEAKITAGLGDVEQWASMLSPAVYQELMKRVDLDFAFTNPEMYQVDDEVEIKLTTKNVQNLIVKIFEINTANYYRTRDREINTDINLDGLVPNWQRTLDYNEAPVRRVERTFKFPEIDHRGVFVIDFIGNGKSSRALVRKGQLHFLMDTTVAGQRFTIVDEDRQPVDDATLWIAGREYTPDDDSRITVPFSTQPGTETVILEHGGLSVRSSFNHLAESWDLRAGIYVDRESLVKGGTANVLVRPQLRVAGQPAPLRLLEDVSLLVRATDLDGIQTTKEFRDLELVEEHETEVEILVPARLQSISFELKARVQNVSRNEPQDLAASQSYNFNEIDRSQSLQTVHMRENDEGFWLAVRGKTGEARPSQAVLLKLKHRLFTDTVTANLQSDERGQIKLGALEDIVWISAQLAGTPEQTWTLNRSRQSGYGTINVSDQQPVHVPFDAAEADPVPYLLELRGNTYYQDRSDKVSAGDGLITVSPLPPGDYELYLGRNGQRTRIQVTSGPETHGFVLGPWRNLERRGSNPLHVTKIDVQEDKMRIYLDGDGSFSRVHVLATRFQPRFNAFAELARVGDIEPLSVRRSVRPSGYIAGRAIGEEYRYILDRRLAQKFPGNMLTRPSLLLNPWAIRTTENEVQVAQTGDEFGGVAPGQDSRGSRGGAADGEQQVNSDFNNLDFLAESAVVLANLLPDKDGIVEIDLELLGDKQMIQVVAQNHFQTLVRHAVLPESPLKYRDLRLAEALDPDNHFAQQKQYTVLRAGEDFELNDATSARFQQYDDLADVYRYFITLTANNQLAEFGFLMDWPNKTDEEKFKLYTKYACHELNFFLLHKDSEYFESVIVPYLRNKLHKTFLDEYLLEMKLDAWIQAWEFQRLNTVEQILLGRRRDDHRQRLNQFIGDDYDNHPTSRRDFDRLYSFAVAGSGLDVDGKMAQLMDRNVRRQLLEEQDADKSEAAAGIVAMDAVPAEGAPATAMPAPQNAYRGRPADPQARAELRERRRSMGRADRSRDNAVDEAEEAQAQFQAGEADDFAGGGFGGRRGEYFEDMEALQLKRKQMQQYFRRLKPTQEWVENNYYHLPIQQQNSDLVRVNRFWRDYALHTPDEPFLSPFFAESSRNFTEMMMALTVLDLPFEKPEHETEFVDNTMRMVPQNDLIAFFEQVRPAVFDRGDSTILVSENFFRVDDRYRTINGKAHEKFIRDEFIANVLYGGQVVITNPTSTPQEIDLLIQIPAGALPAASSHETKTQQMDLAAFSTQTLEYFFYFPTPGDFAHYPAHVSMEARAVAVADPLRFNVVDKPSEIDTESWAWISQNGTENQVLDFLSNENLQSIDLSLIAFRLKDEEFYQDVIEMLGKRFAYNDVLWSYSIHHDDKETIGQFLQHADNFVAQCGIFLQSEILNIEPVIRHVYEHREYWPLVNARAHQLGPNRKILNNHIWGQYHRLLDIVARQTAADDEGHLALAYYMLLQDRIAEGIDHFNQVNVDRLPVRLQYDYCAAYIAMYLEKPDEAAEIADRYKDYPVKRWRDLFVAVTSQVDEIRGGATAVVDDTDQSQQQTAAASQTPSFDFVVESRKTKVRYQNLDELIVNYYQMDVELLFSRNPFVQRQDEGFALIKPNATETVSLSGDSDTVEIDLPDQFRNSNVLVEVIGAGDTKRQAYYANSMTVQLIEQFGQLKITDADSGDMLPRLYVKVYARKADGSLHFYKDGYTDLRGRFDYASLSNQNLDDVNRFSILVISDEFGAIVREADVPKE